MINCRIQETFFSVIQQHSPVTMLPFHYLIPSIRDYNRLHGSLILFLRKQTALFFNNKKKAMTSKHSFHPAEFKVPTLATKNTQVCKKNS